MDDGYDVKVSPMRWSRRGYNDVKRSSGVASRVYAEANRLKESAEAMSDDPSAEFSARLYRHKYHAVAAIGPANDAAMVEVAERNVLEKIKG